MIVIPSEALRPNGTGRSEGPALSPLHKRLVIGIPSGALHPNGAGRSEGSVLSPLHKRLVVVILSGVARSATQRRISGVAVLICDL
jgi:hypothetical protein